MNSRLGNGARILPPTWSFKISSNFNFKISSTWSFKIFPFLGVSKLLPREKCLNSALIKILDFAQAILFLISYCLLVLVPEHSNLNIKTVLLLNSITLIKQFLQICSGLPSHPSPTTAETNIKLEATAASPRSNLSCFLMSLI